MYNFYGEIVAILLFMLVIFSIFYKKLYVLDTTIIVIQIAVLGIIGAILNILASNPNLSNTTSLIITSIYLIIRNFIILYYVYYIMKTLRIDWVLKKNKCFSILYFLPYSIFIISIIINLFTKFMFSIESNILVTGNWFILLGISTFSYFILILTLLVILRRHYTNEKTVVTIINILIVTITIVLQSSIKTIYIEMFGVAITSLFLIIIIENPEERIDVQTNCKKNYAYTHDLVIDFSYKRVFPTIILWMKDYNRITNIVTIDELIKIKRQYTKKLKEILKMTKLKGDIYYNNDGKYSIIIDYDDYDKISTFIEHYNILIDSKPICSDIPSSIIKTNICVILCNKDITDYNFMITFSYLKGINFSNSNYVYYKDIEKNTREKFDLLSKMPKLIDEGFKNNRFEVFYQPIINTSNNKFESAEALIRLKGDNNKYYSPTLFIPICEENGDILKIGELVFRCVCEFIKSSDFETLGLKYIEINVSPKQLMDINFAKNIISITKFYNIDPKYINLEITETYSLSDDDIAYKNIYELKEFGFSFSLDDYGTGYSNIRHVLSLPINLVKIDKSFVKEINNIKMKPIVEKTISMFNISNIKVLVEGIEDVSEVNFFKKLGCEYIQGFYYSKPIKLDDFIKFIKENKKDK